MNLSRIAFAAAAFLAPAVGNASVYRLDGTFNGTPQPFGTMRIDDSVVESGSFNLRRFCKNPTSCESQPVGQDGISFSDSLLQGILTGTSGSYDLVEIRFTFNDLGEIGGSVHIEGDRAAYPVGGQTMDLDIHGNGSIFSGYYVPSDLGGDSNFTMTFVQQGESEGHSVGGKRRPIPEPPVLWTFLAAFLGIAGGARVLRR